MTTQTDPLERQLINQAALISRLRHDLDRLAHEATDTVADLISRIETLEAEPPRTNGDAPTAAWWRDLGPHGTEELWHRPTDWVAYLRSRYPRARKIPACRAEHPELVEDLTALWLAWQHAYQDPDAPLTAAADWHDRWLPGVLYRMGHGVFATDCNAQHQPRPTSAYAPIGAQREPEDS